MGLTGNILWSGGTAPVSAGKPVSDIVYAALRKAGVLTVAGRLYSASQLSDAVHELNRMLGSWSTLRTAIHSLAIRQWQTTPSHNPHTLGPAERALADSRRVSEQTLEFIQRRIEAEGGDATLAQALEGPRGAEIVNRLVDDGIITPQEKPQFTDERGVLTAEGKQRIARLIVGRLFRDSAQFENTPPEIRNKLERAAAPLAWLAG